MAESQEIGSQFDVLSPAENPSHASVKSLEPLQNAAVVSKGLKYWQERIKWNELKSAKQFEMGMGDSMFRGGALSGWSDNQVAALQEEMERMVASVTPADDAKEPDAAEVEDAHDIQPLVSVSALTVPGAGDGDERPQGHKRTKTAALRTKLEVMTQQLERVQNDLDAAEDQVSSKEQELRSLSEAVESEREQGGQEKAAVSEQLAGVSESLRAAHHELEQAEEQILERDQEIENLKRELAIVKQSNLELQQQANADPELTEEDIKKQRVADASRFALMLSAMHQQLDFERGQFTQRLQELEKDVEQRDARLNTMFKLYNDLVTKTKKKRRAPADA